MTRACSALSCLCCFRPRGSDAASAPPASSAPIPLESLESLQRPPSPYFSRSFRPGDGHHTTVTNNGTTQLSGPFGTSQYRLPETAQPSQISRPSTGNQQADPDTQGSDDGFDPTLYENLPYSGASTQIGASKPVDDQASGCTRSDSDTEPACLSRVVVDGEGRQAHIRSKTNASRSGFGGPSA